MTNVGRARTAESASFDIARWEGYFTTRDGALEDVAAMRSSLSWRVTRPLRAATTAARAGARALRGHPARPPHPPGTAAAALDSRLRVVAPVLLGQAAAGSVRDTPTALLVERLCHAARSRGRHEAWLLFVALAGAMPTERALMTFARTISQGTGPEAMADLIELCGRVARDHGSQLRELTLVTDRPVVLVDFIARHGFNSGVQRVAREVSTRWADRGIELVAVTEDAGAFRELDEDERERVLEWHSGMYKDIGERLDTPQQKIVVPWGTTVVMLEVPNERQSLTLTGLARYSGNEVVAIGYDTIPTSSATFVTAEESAVFAAYLATIKHVHKVVAISATTAEEFRGFASALAAQGLSGPEVVAELLPVRGLARGDGVARTAPRDAPPLVVAVGSHEPRKNHIALIYAAERLWREGLRFSVRLLGGRGPHDYTVVDDAVTALRNIGRAIELRNDVTDDTLAEAYATARFTVFLSLHEGYGLPVAESLGTGTPVLVTGYGSTAEIAAGGGCVTVDPRDDEGILTALRELLTDDALVERLRQQIAAREDPGWDDYAAALWRRTFEERPES